MSCLNVMHNEVDCPSAGIPLDQWCDPCRGESPGPGESSDASEER